MSRIIVIGAGWAGLNCAYELSKAGHQITMLEAAPQAGGRARSINFQNYILDNGQHLAIGAYHSLRQILRELNIAENKVFKIMPLHLRYENVPQLTLKLSNLIPAPFNLLFGILTAKNWPWRDKAQVFKFCYQIANINFQLPNDCTVMQMLMNYNQSEFIIRHFWEPLALAIMTTEIEMASAQVFLNVLKQSFIGKRTNSNWYVPSVDLSALLPVYIEDYLRSKGHNIVYNQAVKELKFNANGSMIAISKQEWHAEHIIIATQPWQAAELIASCQELQSLRQSLTAFSFQPITTIYLIFDQPLQLANPIVGLTNTKCQWIVDRGFAGQKNILSAVISGPQANDYTSQEQLAQIILTEIHSVFPDLPNLLDFKFICEKRAAFTCDVAIQTMRPHPKTKIKNLWLTGDYLQTGLPATLEGALLSGKQTADCINKI